MPLQVQPLDIRIRRNLLKRIVSGEMAPGLSINEARLADELGVSRTPLRQALARLEQDGFLVSRPNHGFFVASLSGDEAGELYPILAALEGLAVRLAPPGPDELAGLQRLNRELGEVDPEHPDAAVRANFRWHEALVAGCDNRRLTRMLETIRRQVYRYEISFFSPGAERLEKSLELHRAILGSLERGDLADAALKIDEHWRADLDSLAPDVARAEPGRDEAG